MSEERFKKAKGYLAFSQQLVDRLRQPQMAQEDPVSPETGPQAPQEVPVAQPAPQPEITPPAQNEAGMLSTIMEEIRNLFKGKEEQEKVTQELVDKHNKEIVDIKQGLTDLLHEDTSKN